MFLQSDKHAPRPIVMLLACPHIGSSAGGNVLQEHYDDMLAPERQRQIAECVERLKAFRPNKVAVEELVSQQSRVDADYRDYREGRFLLTASEEHQIGFRLAAELRLPRVFAIDSAEEETYAGKLGDAIVIAKETQAELYDMIVGTRHAAIEQRHAEISKTTILGLLRQHNDPVAIREDHKAYLLLSLVMSGEAYVGIGWVQGWYARNLRIYTNLARIIESSDDRVLVVFGAGHVGLLVQFLSDSGLFQIEPAFPYLA